MMNDALSLLLCLAQTRARTRIAQSRSFPACFLDNGVVVLAMVYGKGEQADLTMAQRRSIAAALRVLSEQSKGEVR